MATRAPRRRSAVSIADVARAAEVSTATVSNALNGTGRLGVATRDRVRSVAAALGYPSTGARGGRTLALAAGGGQGPAWLYDEDSHFGRVLATATAVAHSRGYALTVPPAGSRLEPSPADGALLLESPPGDPLPAALRSRGLPYVFLGRPASPTPGTAGSGTPGSGAAGSGAPSPWVDNDHDAGTRTVLDHLVAAGGRRVAMVAGDTAEHYTDQCVRTYLAWCAERGRRPILERTRSADLDGRSAVHRLLSGPGRPDAVYGVYDHLGHVLLEGARRRGLRAPGDLMIACASDRGGYAFTDPPLTTLALHPDETARRGVTMLIDLIEGRRPAASRRTVPTRLHVRGSTSRGPAAAWTE